MTAAAAKTLAQQRAANTQRGAAETDINEDRDKSVAQSLTSKDLESTAVSNFPTRQQQLQHGSKLKVQRGQYRVTKCKQNI
jgi:hypothetical protein